MKRKRLQIAQLNQKLAAYNSADEVNHPSIGWVKTIRTSLGISLEQLGAKLGITKQSVHHLEKREGDGSITIKALEEAAQALDMRLVYGFVPIDGSVERLIEKKARHLATEIVMRTSANMKLEDQENSPERIQKAINERTREFMEELPRELWD